MSGTMHLKAEKDGSGGHGNADVAPKRRVALLGAGYIADWHAKCLQSVAGVELVAVCDQVRARAEVLAATFGVAKTYASLEAMLEAEKLDAVHVLLPPDLHFAAASTVMKAGLSVFLEKPMCDRADRCEELVRIAAEHGVHLGVGHNFLFSRPYEQLRRDVGGGILGRIDQIRITWNRFLPQSAFGPFDTWMLRDPRNMMLETGSHLVAHMLDLVGEPDEMEVRAGNAIELPTGRSFYRRWQVNAVKGPAAIGLHCSFVPGFAEYNIHVRGSLASATADIERNTYTLDRYRPADPDFENYAMVAARAKYTKAQARWTLARYVLSKLHLERRGTAYGESIAGAMDAFYGDAESGAEERDERISGQFGARVIRVCEQIAERANLPAESVRPRVEPGLAGAGAQAGILVLGGAGFIGKELLRQLVASGRGVRVLVRSAAGLPEELRSKVDCQTGNLLDRDALLRAMEGTDCVVHLARAHVKSWAEYEKYEIEATRLVGECALQAGVKRLIYAGTIDSYYAGKRGSTITEATPLDPRIKHRNLYARAKAASEAMLMQMHRERKLPLVIVRPGIVIGRGGSPFHWGVGMWWHDAVCQIWGQGENKLPLVLVEDVARGLVAAIDTPDLDGRDFNLVADPCLSAQEYLDELDRAGGMRVQRYATPILRFYLLDMLKWVVKVAVRHPERQMPSYRDWKSRTQQARFDSTAAKMVLGWNPVSERDELVRKGIEEPLREFLQ
ncbi:MAG: NAD-dependent epimerase/dehydratase family protein [Terracidiphilus sp.]|jgi:predicted dehydrogenase/nucleoside-diphosphate-sugar epimerase